jgi:hypothetical protein
VQVVYARQPFPTSVSKTIFLAGPTPRSSEVPSWRPRAMELLRARGFDGHVFVPEDASGGVRGDYDDQIEWELTGLGRADAILFWVPRQLETMPAFTTNVEFGLFAPSGRAILAAPSDAAKIRYLREVAARRWVPSLDSLEAAVDAALTQVGEGVARSGGECCVPAMVFRSPAFQSWYAAQRAAGNELRSAAVEWVLRTGPERDWLFLWALRVDVFVRAEGRSKRNEVVLGRPDTSQVVMLHRSKNILDSEVVLVREFRSAARTADGFVHETPGGSSYTGVVDPLALAVEEVAEEVGLQLPAARFRPLGSRQLAATLLSHHAHAFVVELSDDELAQLRASADQVRGNLADSERTHLDIRTLASLLADPSVDWSTLGLVWAALGDRLLGPNPPKLQPF